MLRLFSFATRFSSFDRAIDFFLHRKLSFFAHQYSEGAIAAGRSATMPGQHAAFPLPSFTCNDLALLFRRFKLVKLNDFFNAAVCFFRLPALLLLLIDMQFNAQCSATQCPCPAAMLLRLSLFPFFHDLLYSGIIPALQQIHAARRANQ